MKAIKCGGIVFFILMLLSCGEDTAGTDITYDTATPPTEREINSSDTASESEQDNTDITPYADSDANWQANEENTLREAEPSQGNTNADSSLAIDSDSNWSKDRVENTAADSLNTDSENDSQTGSGSTVLPPDSDANWTPNS